MKNITDDIIKNFKLEIKSKEYNIGDTINFERPHHKKDPRMIKCEGKIYFGIYSDMEGYIDDRHLGIFIKYEYYPYENYPVQKDRITFPDFVSRINDGTFNLI